MGDFQKALAAVGSVKTPITVTALIIVVFYYLVQQILSLKIFSVLTQADTYGLLHAVLDKIFWLAILGLIFGAILFALPYVFPKRLNSKVTIIDQRLNGDLSAYDSFSDKEINSKQ